MTVPCVASAVASANATPTASATLRAMPGCETVRREADRGWLPIPHRSMRLRGASRPAGPLPCGPRKVAGCPQVLVSLGASFGWDYENRG